MRECSQQEGKEPMSIRMCRWSKSGITKRWLNTEEHLFRRNKELFPAPCARQVLLLEQIRQFWHMIEISKASNKHSPKPIPIIKMHKGKIKPYS